jgi:uncharacterized Zn finger protein
MECSCPDYAGMCKHIAATLYGIGTAIDSQPEWLFALRHLDHLELFASATSSEIVAPLQTNDNVLEAHELSALFNIELETPISSPSKEKEGPKKRGKTKSKNK